MKNPAFERWAKENPELAEAYKHLHRTAVCPGNLDQKTKQLIYLAVLVTLRYAPAFKAHLPAAVKTGATVAEIREAIMVGLPASGVVNTLAVYDEVADALEALETSA